MQDTIAETAEVAVTISITFQDLNLVVLARDISLHVTGPEKLCIIGKNGAGKTTLLRKIAAELLGRRITRTFCPFPATGRKKRKSEPSSAA